jgi:hypothetical protein
MEQAKTMHGERPSVETTFGWSEDDAPDAEDASAVVISASPSLNAARLRRVLGRLARGPGDAAGALALLLLLRVLASERREAVVIELSSYEDAMLLTIEHEQGSFWLAEMFPFGRATVEAALVEVPELLEHRVRASDAETFTLRIDSRDGDAHRMTPVALPSLQLLVEAGLAPRSALATSRSQ